MKAVSNALVLCFSMLVAACGGGSSSTTGVTTTTTTTATTPTSIAAGATYTIPANTSVLVPSGTTVKSPNGSTVTVNGSNNTINTQAGAVVSVPATSTGAANNTVTTVQASGSSSSSSTGATVLNPTITVLAGLNSGAPVDGSGVAAVFTGGGNLLINGGNNIIVSDAGRLRKVTQAGVVTTLNDGTSASIYWQGIAVDGVDNLYGSGSSIPSASTSSAASGASIVELHNTGVAQTLFANWETSSINATVGSGGLAIDSAGNLFLADAGTQRILKFNPKSVSWAVFAGSGTQGNADGSGTAATLNIAPGSDMPIDSSGNLYVNSSGTIRKITPNGMVTTLYTNLPSITGALALDSSGNFYVSAFQSISRISSNGSVATFAIPNSTYAMTSMATDRTGNLYAISRGFNVQVFKISF